MDTVLSSLQEQLGLDRDGSQALLDGLEALGNYVCATVEGGDALSEEDSAVQASREVIRPVLQARLQRRLDDLERKLAPAICPDCGTTMLSKGRRTARPQSLFGPVELQRRYARCPACGTSCFPSQDKLLLGSERTTARLSEAVSMLCAVVSYEMATKLCKDLFGVEVSCHGAQQIVHRRASIRDQVVDREARRYQLRDSAGRPRNPRRPYDARDRKPEVTYLECDGVYAMTRQYELPADAAPEQGNEHAQREHPDKQTRGGAGRRYKLEGREIKNAILYSDDDTASLANRRGCLLRKTYVSVLGTPQDLALQLGPELLRQRADKAKLFVSISDGAVWIRNLVVDLPFKVLQILDLYHVKHRVHEAGKAMHPDDELAARRWSKLQTARIEQGDLSLVLETLAQAKPPKEASAKILAELATYLGNNRDRMDYPRYRSMGLRVGSGAIESTNHHLTGGRLRQQGMRWNEAGAAEMTGLRADLFNGRWRMRSRQVLAAAA